MLGLSWGLGLSWVLGLSWMLGLCPRHNFQGLVPPCSHIPWATRVKPLILFFITESCIYSTVLGVSRSMWDLQPSLWHADLVVACGIQFPDQFPPLHWELGVSQCTGPPGKSQVKPFKSKSAFVPLNSEPSSESSPCRSKARLPRAVQRLLPPPHAPTHPPPSPSPHRPRWPP